jgi:choline transporter-like protein 2/4/5
VLFLILFAAYLAAMAAVAGIAFKEGDARRLAYGLDSRGLLCGANNSLGNGSYLDLTDRPNLYYLNTLDLLNASTIAYAKSVCVADCPGDAQRCRADALPCAAAAQYRCPYYKYAEDGLYGALSGGDGGAPLDDADTEYWGALANVSAAASGACDAAFLAAANGAVRCGLFSGMLWRMRLLPEERPR